MNDFQVITLPPDEWEEYKNLNLIADSEEPQAFGLTYGEVLKIPDEHWRNQLEKAQNKDNLWIYFAKVNGEVSGIIAANVAHNGEKTKFKHIVLIHSVFVKKQFRGRGIASKILETILRDIEQRSDLLKAQMGVAATQDAAIGLYKKFGFEVIGIRKKVFKDGDEFIDEVLMDKMLS